jgi:FkbM family methyltransferase
MPKRLEQLARMALRRIPAATVVRVLAGPLRGLRWVAGAAPHGAWLGRLERDLLDDFSAHIAPGAVVWDLGANVGLYTLAAARRAGPTGSVIAFEPAAANVQRLERHVALNRLSNVRIVAAAVADHEGAARLAAGTTPSEFHLAAEGDEVPCVTLDAWREREQQPMPSVVKIDVEGAESAVLAGGERTFLAARPRIYLAVHGDQPDPCRAILHRWGYRLLDAAGRDWTPGQSEWVCVPGREPSPSGRPTIARVQAP